MRYEEINRRFTELVTEYIGKGYWFNTATMNGSQGEIAKADLTNGKEVIRINLAKMYEHEKGFYCDGIELTVGIATDRITPNSNDTWQTLWTNKCEVIHREKWYNAGRDSSYLVTREEAVEAWNKREERWERNHTNDRKDLTERAAVIAHKFVKRQNRCKGAKVADVRVEKRGAKFYVLYKSKEWKLA